MAKKKQFAGKKTKLARLPLTQALANQLEGGASGSPLPTSSLALSTQLPLTWEEIEVGRGEPLMTAFISLVRELAELQAELRAPLGSPAVNLRTFLPDRLPPQPQVRRALHQARQSLLDLQSLLSHP
jgi:hypothetical protein